MGHHHATASRESGLIPNAQLIALIEDPAKIDAAIAIKRRRRIEGIFPNEGQYRRDLYPKHLEFFRAGKDYRERAFIAGNRTGKTVAGAYEAALHLTGNYPIWWPGKRFTKATRGWAAGNTSKTVKEILQAELLGQPGAIGTGMIPGDLIVKTTAKQGLADAVETVWVRHVSGGYSVLVFKSYDQKRQSFEGTAQDFIWLDEECPMDIYTECLLRTMTTNGCVNLTFTPLQGLTEVVLQFLPDGQMPEGKMERCIVMAGWDDVPHLDEKAKKELESKIPAYQRDARMKGVPQLGSGAIYPVSEDSLLVDPFEIPAHWARAYGMDVGWKRTAVVWGARDADTDVIYLHSEHYQGQAEPASHALAVNSRGDWVPGLIDPAARGRSQVDGKKLIEMYVELGLKLETANNAVESGIYEVWQRMLSGRLKIFSNLSSLRSELRLYRRDEKGHIVKEFDHLMDAMRYLVMGHLDVAVRKPVQKAVIPIRYQPQRTRTGGNTGWMR